MHVKLFLHLFKGMLKQTENRNFLHYLDKKNIKFDLPLLHGKHSCDT